MALSLEDITFCMQKIELDKEKYNALVQELEAAEEEKKAAREGGKKKRVKVNLWSSLKAAAKIRLAT